MNTNESRTVYRAGAQSSGPRPIHVDRDCPRVTETDRLREHDPAELQDDIPECQWCGGDGKPANAAGESDWSYQEALERASAKN